MRRIVAVVAILVAATSCSSDPSVEDQLGLPDTSRPCDEVFATGVEVTEELAGAGCKQSNGRGLIPIGLSLDCNDGRTLTWNEFGWGYVGNRWAGGELPDAVESACAYGE